nr:MAG TPA: RNA-dependent RNA polymerase [Riboviria sp.]
MEGAVPLRTPRNGSFAERVGDSVHRKRYFTLWLPNGFEPVVVHDQCDHNQYISLRNRVQMECPPVQPVELGLLRSCARDMAPGIGRVDPCGGEWLDNYPGRKRRLYRRAQRELAVKPLHRKDRTVKAFIKAEKMPDEPKDPRMIQARGPRFNLVFGDYTRALEKHLYKLNGKRLPQWLPRGRVLAKGLNLRDRARLIHQKFERFGVCHSLDLSRFDAHVSQELLGVCHLFYLRCFRNDRLLRRLLSWQLVNNCYSSCWHYNSIGGRMSGDMDTALGNCFLMLAIVSVAMRLLGLTPTEWDCFVDGDDTLLFTRADVSRLPGIFRAMGQELKIEQTATTYHGIQHCCTRPVLTVRGRIMVADPRRVVARTLVGCQHWQDRRFWKPYLGLLGLCNLALHSGVPVLQAYALMLQRWSGGMMPRKLGVADVNFKALIELRSFAPVETPITPDARASFAEAWGMEPDEQRFWERLFAAAPPPWSHGR